MTSQPPTRGQQHVLQLLCRAAYVLWTTPSGSLAVTHTLIERGTGRHIMTLTPKMVDSLLDAGWIEREPDNQPHAATWILRVTPAGVGAANAPRR